jgi:hypothetical protein
MSVNLQTNQEPTRSRKTAIKATRPALIDLRFKGDAWIVCEDHRALVQLGDTLLTNLPITRFDLPALNRTFQQVRIGQARRNYIRRIKKLNI